MVGVVAFGAFLSCVPRTRLKDDTAFDEKAGCETKASLAITCRYSVQLLEFAVCILKLCVCLCRA